RVDVEIVGERAHRELCAAAVARVLLVRVWAVHGAVVRRGVLADVLHHVDLAAHWPVDLLDVVSKHPERGPHALAGGDLHPRGEAAERLLEEAGLAPILRDDLARRVLTGTVPASEAAAALREGLRDDVEIAAALMGVRGPGRVVLP